jgi:multidrug efflux pump subunit AcrB
MSSETVRTVQRSRHRAPPARHSSTTRRAGAVRLAGVAIVMAVAIVTLLTSCERNDTQDHANGSASSRGAAGGGGALIAIITEQDGATAEAMERDVIAPIEAAVEPRPGVRHVRSTIRDGRGVVIVELARGRELNAVFPALQTAVNGIRSVLPVGLPPPSVVLGDPDAAPAIWLAATGPVTAVELSEIVREAIVPRLQRVAGVRDIEVRGETTRAVIIRLDPRQLDELGITVADVQTALGRITGRHGGGALRDLAMLGAVELAQSSGAPIRLGDIATIEDGIASRPDPGGGPMMLGVRVQPGVDPDPVIAAARAAAIEVAVALPPGCALTEAPAPPHAAGDRRSFAIAVSVRGPTWATLERLADKLERDLRARRVLVSAVASDHRAGATVQRIEPDLDRAAYIGVSPAEISTTVRGLTIGPGKLQAGAHDTPIVLRVGSQDAALSRALDQVRVRTARGELILLSAIATVTTRPSVVLTRRDRERAITISVDPIAWPLRDVVRRKIAELTRDLPAGYRATVLPWP